MGRRAKKKQSLVIVLGFCAALASCDYSLSVGAPQSVARSAENSLAAATVAIQAAVTPNVDNTLASELAQKQQSLDAQQQAIQQEESALSKSRSLGNDPYGLYSFLASLALFFLVGLNFYFDRRRSRTPGRIERALTVDLRART